MAASYRPSSRLKLISYRITSHLPSNDVDLDHYYEFYLLVFVHLKYHMHCPFEYNELGQPFDI